MKEAYVSYEVAKLLKKKGFDWDCEHYYKAEQIYNLYRFLNRPNLNLEKGQTDDSNND